MKVLILGHKGMLGNMVHLYFQYQKIDCVVIEDRWPSEAFNDKISTFDGNYIINCIGAIPQKTKSFIINYQLPQTLEKRSKKHIKIIHPGSDCEMENDGYGCSKRMASEWIKDNLLSWFLSCDSITTILGYSKCFWNGVTTLEWAKHCYWGHCFDWEQMPKEQILRTGNISKYQLLEAIGAEYKKDIKITPVNKPVINRCLSGGLLVNNIASQLEELRIFYEKYGNYEEK